MSTLLTEINQDQSQLFAEKLINAIQEEKLKIPTQPEVAVRLRECAEDPNITPAKLAHVISHDPAMTAKFIQIANSPLNRGSIAIDSLPNVINRLGLKYVCNIATGLAMEQIFQATNENIDKLMYDAWTSSTYVAAYAHVLAKNYSSVPCDVASLAGLLHQIGVLPILSYVQDSDEISNDMPFLMSLIKDHHAKIGEAVLRSWQLPPEIYLLPQQLYIISNNENENANLTHIIQAALVKTKDENKHFIEIDTLSDNVFKHLNVDKEEALKSDKQKSELQDSVKFYCQLQ